MNKPLKLSAHVLAILITTVLTVSPALADKPEGKGKGRERAEKGDHRQDNSRNDDRGHRESGNSAPKAGAYFADQHRGYVRNYYDAEYRRGFCPPGLAKKNNGCMPPGQAKKWKVGKPLPRDVVFYEVPPTLVTQIGPPPSGYRYVRTSGDILLIKINTGIVIDVLVNLGRV